MTSYSATVNITVKSFYQGQEVAGFFKLCTNKNLYILFIIIYLKLITIKIYQSLKFHL